MFIDPADDEINIFLPIAFIIFITFIVILAVGASSLIYHLLKKMNVIKGKSGNKIH
jgi:hypothetical protein